MRDHGHREKDRPMATLSDEVEDVSKDRVEIVMKRILMRSTPDQPLPP